MVHVLSKRRLVPDRRCQEQTVWDDDGPPRRREGLRRVLKLMQRRREDGVVDDLAPDAADLDPVADLERSR